MITAVLFDLDDTLLGNDMNLFLPHYFELLGNFVEPIMPKAQFLPQLLASTQAMIEDVDTAVTNRQVFWNHFCHQTGLEQATLESYIEQFYRQEFPKLQPLTQQRPLAKSLVRAAFGNGRKVVIATNPLFPRIAIEERLTWAGVPASAHDYALVTTYENMHAAKPQPAYYREILSVIDCPPQSALMIGDDWENDIEPAAAINLQTYWVCSDEAVPPQPELSTAYGSLGKLKEGLENGRFS